MLTQSELVELWRKHDFRPSKRMGQSFLIDKNIRDKILDHVRVSQSKDVVEIGPGFGELTAGLASSAKRVIAIEKDKHIAEILKTDPKARPNISVLNEDFLKSDLEKISKGEKVVIYGNLPYYITSPMIDKLLHNLSFISDIYLVVQKEVGERIVALPGTKAIGRLSYYVQYHTDPKLLFTIKQGSFFPAPKVDSVFLQMSVRQKKKVEVNNESLMFDIIKKAYTQRRKTLQNSLSDLGIEKPALTKLLESAEIPPKARPETLSLEHFARLANALPS